MVQSSQIISDIKERIKSFESKVTFERVGTIKKLADGVAIIEGLSDAMMGEMLDFGDNIKGLALNLEENKLGAIILGDYYKLKEGGTVKSTEKILETPVGDNLIGRVVDPLGNPLDGKGPIETKETRPIEKIAPGVIQREPVNTPVQTGIKAIDSMTPIGRGQRELIIGDRQTGKTALAIDTIINQKGKDLICIYVAIGQKQSKIAKIVAELEKRGSMEHTIVVLASASNPASILYIAPYAGCTIGEYFMDNGKDALIIYDDLSKHAWAYRQISLILRRPPGREAYPGDIFYLHSRLLERACKLNKDHGGGSLTALPIIETQAGDISAYIPTNIISITDGQIYLESDLFYAGTRPALNSGLSVSRVGSKAQTKAMKEVAGSLRLDLAQFRELAAFAEFGAELEESTRKKIERGKRTTEILKQPQYNPAGVEKEILAIYAVTKGHFDDIKVEKVREAESKLIEFFEGNLSKLLEEIADKKELNDEIKEKMNRGIKDFKDTLPENFIIKKLIRINAR